MTLHGGLIRTVHIITLEAKEQKASHTDYILTDKWQHVDNFVNVDHAFPNCTSNQLFKGVLDDMSTGAFNGQNSCEA